MHLSPQPPSLPDEGLGEGIQPLAVLRCDVLLEPELLPAFVLTAAGPAGANSDATATGHVSRGSPTLI